MANEIQKFSHPQHGTMRITVNGGKEWYCLGDVCKALTIGNPSDMKKRLQERGVATIDTPTTNQFGATVIQQMTYIDEANLYRCIFQSRKEEAVKFQDWIFEEVIPSIRKHGAYLTPATLSKMLENPEYVTSLLETLHTEQMKRQNAEKTIAEQRPKVEFAEALESSDSCIEIGALANILKQNGYDTGRIRLFHKLRELQYLCKTSRRPMQKAINAGLMEVKVGLWTDKDGNTHEDFKPMVTPKGQRYFVEMFCK